MPGVALALGSLSSPNKGGGVPVAPDVVVILAGDSNARGTAAAADQNAYIASYVVDPNILVWSATAQDWVVWTPGTYTGFTSINTANGDCGPEIGFIRRFQTAQPGRRLRLIKPTAPGSTASRGPVVSSITASIASNVLTTTVGTALGSHILIGTGVPSKTHVSTSTGFVRTLPGTTYGGGNVASTSMSQHNASLAWHPDEGARYGGQNGGKGLNDHVPDALANLTTAGISYTVAGLMLSLFGNDGAADYTSALAQAAGERLLQVFRADLPSLASIPVMWSRPRNAGGASGPQVRAALVTMAATDSLIKIIETDGLARHDGVHLNIVGLDTVGSLSFDQAVF